jgi:hypothetical protein
MDLTNASAIVTAALDASAPRPCAGSPRTDCTGLSPRQPKQVCATGTLRPCSSPNAGSGRACFPCGSGSKRRGGSGCCLGRRPLHKGAKNRCARSGGRKGRNLGPHLRPVPVIDAIAADLTTVIPRLIDGPVFELVQPARRSRHCARLAAARFMARGRRRASNACQTTSYRACASKKVSKPSTPGSP